MRSEDKSVGYDANAERKDEHPNGSKEEKKNISKPLFEQLCRIARCAVIDARRRWIRYFFVCGLCCVQDFLLTELLDMPRTLTRFMVWNALYTFGWIYWKTQRSRNLAEAGYVFVANAAMYAFSHAIRPFMAHFITISFYVPIMVLVMTAVEYLHFLCFEIWLRPQKRGRDGRGGGWRWWRSRLRGESDVNNKTESDVSFDDDRSVVSHLSDYVVRRAPEQLVMFIVILEFIAGMYFLDCSADPFRVKGGGGWWQRYLAAVPNGIISDILFGVPHNLSHRIPKLWRLHKVHHEYRGHDLNLFANNYSNPVDGFIAAQPAIIAIFQDYLLGLSAWHLVDGAISAVFAHHKYAGQYIVFYDAYEMDILFDVLAQHKISLYHHLHHVNTAKRFGISGYVSDQTIGAIADIFYSSTAELLS